MNVLFFVGRIVYGGGEKVRNWLAKTLAEDGHTVYYAIDSNILDAEKELASINLSGVINVIQYDMSIKKHNTIKYLSQIKYLYQHYHIDLLIYFGGSLIEQVMARKCGIKVVLSERSYNGMRPFPSRVLKQIQYRVADGYVFQTPEASLIYGKRANKRSVVIPNPIIDNLPAPQLNNLRKEIVSVGRLSRPKDFETLIHAFALFYRYNPDYKLVIYGSGPLKNQLQELINRLGLDSAANIISGELNIVEKENGAELFVLSTTAEGMPNALIEAMSVGMLCISTDCPIYGPRMLITSGVNGYLVPMRSPMLLADKMSEALSNSSKADKMRRKALEIRDTLEQAKIASMWKDFLNKIAN